MAGEEGSWRCRPLLLPLVVMVLWCWLAGAAMGDFSSDQAECAEALVGLSTCLTYVEGSAKAQAPTPDCCSGLKQVIGKSPKCLCILIKDRDSPQLGFKIDANRAMALPAACSIPANISHCPGLLKLDPESKEAQIFKQFGNSSNQGNATTSSASGVPGRSSSGVDSSGKQKDSSAAASRSHGLLGLPRSVGMEVVDSFWAYSVLSLSLVILGG